MVRILAWIDDFLGKRDQALRRLNEAVALAWGLAHPYSLAFALSQTMILRLSRGEVVQTLEAAESGIQLCSEHRFAQWLGEARFHRGWALAAQGKQPEGIALMRQGLAALRATGCQTVVPFYLGELARVCADVGRSDEGLAALMEALVDVDRTEERVWEAELHRLRGEFWLKSPDSDPTSAEVCFRKAIAIAEGQSAKVWELRAATSLARLWGDRDRHAQAHNLLAPIYDRFTEGFDTADLEDAKALLDELR
jgi:predicted ATPase